MKKKTRRAAQTCRACRRQGWSSPGFRPAGTGGPRRPTQSYRQPSMPRFTTLHQRAREALLAKLASRNTRDGHLVDFYRPEREAQVLQHALMRNATRLLASQGVLRNEEIVRLFREIMSACLAQEEPLKVAFLGSRGHVHANRRAQALRTFRARDCRSASIDEVFHEVESAPSRFRRRADRKFHRGHGQSHAGSLPLEFATQDLRRSGAAYSTSASWGACESIERHTPRICGHPQALAQCRRLARREPARRSSALLSQATPKVRPACARRRRAPPPSPAAQRPPKSMALTLLATRDRRSRPDNTTRFFVVGRQTIHSQWRAIARHCWSRVHRQDRCRRARSVSPTRAAGANTASA